MIPIRVLLSLATAAAVALPLFISGPILPAPEAASSNSFNQTVNPEPVEIFCPGGLIRQGGETGTDIGQFEIATAALIQASGEDFVPKDFPTETKAGIAFRSSSSNFEQSTLDLVAGSLIPVSEKRMAGLAAINCAQPVGRGTLVSGDSQVGTESLLIVSNPQSVETLVTISVFGLEEPKTQSLILAAGEQKYLSLASLAGDASKYVVQFESAAGEVSVVMQQRTVSGLSPTGVELSDWVTTPLNKHVFPAVTVRGSSLSPDKSLSQPNLRIFNPSDTQDQSTIYLVSASSSKTVTVVTEPGEITDTVLDLPDGDWVAFVDSTQEVFAAVRNPVFAARADFEWLNAANEIKQALALMAWSNADLHLANPTDETISYQISGLGQVAVSAKSKVKVAVPRGKVVVESASQIWAALTVLSDSGFAAIEPRENRNFGADLRVLIY